MKKLFLLIFLFPVFLTAQRTDNCEPTLLYQVKTKSGMKMRQGPGQNNKVVVYVPSHQYLLVCKEKATPATYEGEAGHWRRVRYKQKYGYMFDGFLIPADKNLQLNDSAWIVVEMPNVQQIIDTNNRNEISESDELLIPDSIYQTHHAADSNNVNHTDTTVVKEEEEPVEVLPPPPPADYIFAVETYNYCGSINGLDPGIRWYGIYYDEDLKVYKNRRINLQIIRSKYSLGSGVEFDIRSETGVSPHFMIGTKTKLDTNFEINFDLDYFCTQPEQLFPGQKVNLYATVPRYDLYNFTMYATGNVSSVGICPTLSDYKLKLTGEMNDKLIVQDLTEDISFFGDCGIPRIYWFGDLNQDLYPDIILASQSKDQTTFTLFVSDTRNNGKLMRLAGEWTSKKCD